MEIIDKKVIKVNPVVIVPPCMTNNASQGDCFTCKLWGNVCKSPKSMCITPYKNHKLGCPNFGKKANCPPNNNAIYDRIFDVSDTYAIITEFDLESFYDKRRAKSPDLAEGQIKNSRIWQPITEKENDWAAADFFRENPDKNDYVATRDLECTAVHVVNTLRNVGIDILFPPKRVVYRISFAARPYLDELDRNDYTIREERTGRKKGLRTLVKRLY